MFEGVDDIHWQQFGECHIAIGMKTSEIPTCIRNMLHEDSEEREFAIACLLGEGQHLGMLGAATPYIIPFVLEVLAQPGYSERGYLMMGMALMFTHMLPSESFSHLRLCIQIYDEIRKGYALYKPLLNDVESYTRLFTAQVLAYMQDDAEDALEALSARLTAESDPEVRVALIRAIMRLVWSLPPWSDESFQKIDALYAYIKDNGSFEEQVEFARPLRNFHNATRNTELIAFVAQTLAKADAKPK